jgi:pimeloyl-ACP methyl ester carboxylesterase
MNRAKPATVVLGFGWSSTRRRPKACGSTRSPSALPVPGHQDTWVDYSADRAPLPFIGGEQDHIMPPAVNKSKAEHYHKSPAPTEYFEFAGRDHWTWVAPGWEAVANHALEWGLAHASTDRLWLLSS